MSKGYNDVRCRMKRSWCGFARFCGDDPWAAVDDDLSRSGVGGLDKHGIASAQLDQVGWLCTNRLSGPVMLKWFQSRALPWGPASRSSTVPVCARDQARLVARVVLPTPPFWLTIATTVIALLQPKRCWNGTDNALPSAANAGTVSISLASDASSGTTPVKTALSLRL